MSRITIIQTALNELGAMETGTNIQKYSRFFGKEGLEWCFYFYAWVLAQTGYLSAIGTVERVVQLAWVPSALKVWTQLGLKTTSPLPGDAVIFNYDGQGDPDHIGMFICWLVPGLVFLTIEGNMANGVRLKIRNYAPAVHTFFNVTKLP